MHIAFIRFSSLGDVVLQTSIVTWVKFHFPKTNITFITSKEFSSLVIGHPHIDEVILIERKKGKEDLLQLKKLSNELEQKNVNLLIDLHNTLRAKLLRLFAYKIPALTVDKRSLFRKLLVNYKVDLLSKLEPHVERTIKDLSFIFKREFLKEDVSVFLQDSSPRKNLGLTSLPSSFVELEQRVKKPYIAISPVASFETKRWPMTYVKELIDLIIKSDDLSRFQVVLIAGPNDKYCSEIKEESWWGNRYLNLQGKTSLKESSEILGEAECVISNDTGSTHMAEAYGVPVISIFGSTSPSFGFRPHLNNSEFLWAGVSCSPCSATGSRPCKKNKLECMLAISATDVFEKLKTNLRDKI